MDFLTSETDTETGEPVGVLVMRGRFAPLRLRAWAAVRVAQILIGTKPHTDYDKVDEARKLAQAMTAWRKAR